MTTTGTITTKLRTGLHTRGGGIGGYGTCMVFFWVHIFSCFWPFAVLRAFTVSDGVLVCGVSGGILSTVGCIAICIGIGAVGFLDGFWCSFVDILNRFPVYVIFSGSFFCMVFGKYDGMWTSPGWEAHVVLMVGSVDHRIRTLGQIDTLPTKYDQNAPISSGIAREAICSRPPIGANSKTKSIEGTVL